MRAQREDVDDSSPKRIKLSEEKSESSGRRERTHHHDSSLDHHRSKIDDVPSLSRDDDNSRRTASERIIELHRYQDGEKKSSKKKKTKEKKATEEVTRETNWLASNLRVRIVDQKYKSGHFYNTKVMLHIHIHVCMHRAILLYLMHTVEI